MRRCPFRALLIAIAGCDEGRILIEVPEVEGSSAILAFVGDNGEQLIRIVGSAEDWYQTERANKRIYWLNYDQALGLPAGPLPPRMESRVLLAISK